MLSGPRRIRRGPQAFGLNLATSADLLRVWFAPRITGDEKSPLTCGHFHVTPLDAAEPAFRARARRIVPISELVFGALTQTGVVLSLFLDLPRLPARRAPSADQAPVISPHSTKQWH